MQLELPGSPGVVLRQEKENKAAKARAWMLSRHRESYATQLVEESLKRISEEEHLVAVAAAKVRRGSVEQSDAFSKCEGEVEWLAAAKRHYTTGSLGSRGSDAELAGRGRSLSPSSVSSGGSSSQLVSVQEEVEVEEATDQSATVAAAEVRPLVIARLPEPDTYVCMHA